MVGGGQLIVSDTATNMRYLSNSSWLVTAKSFERIDSAGPRKPCRGCFGERVRAAWRFFCAETYSERGGDFTALESGPGCCRLGAGRQFAEKGNH